MSRAIEFHDNILIQGQCSDRWSGFDGCPVALAGIGTYC